MKRKRNALKMKRASDVLFLLFFVAFANIFGEQFLDVTKIGDESTVQGFSFSGDSAISLKGCSKGLGIKKDDFLYAYTTYQGDFNISLKEIAITPNDTAGRYGIMIRSELCDSSSYVCIGVSKNSGSFISYRSAVGDISATIIIDKSIYSSIGIERVGNKYSFKVKHLSDTLWETFPAAYIFNHPLKMNVGIFHSSDDTTLSTETIYKKPEGFVDKSKFLDSTLCEPLSYDFDLPFNIENSSFKPNVNWELDSAGYLKSTTFGGWNAASFIVSPIIYASRIENPVTFYWDVNLSGVNCGSFEGKLNNYLVFGEKTITLDDNCYVSGTIIGSNGDVNLGSNIQHNTADINAQGDLNVESSSWLKGNVKVGGVVNHGSNVQFFGSIVTGASVVTPVIGQKSVATGNDDLNISASQVYYISPGYYGNVTINDNSHVYFSSGVYNFKTLKTMNGVALRFNIGENETAELNISEEFTLGSKTQILFDGKTNIYTNNNNPEVVTFYTNQTLPVQIEDNVCLAGKLYAPKATVNIGEKSIIYGGGIFADVVNISKNVQLWKFIDGDTLTNGADYDELVVSFYNDTLLNNAYQFHFTPQCEGGADDSREFSFRHNSTELAFANSNVPTPKNQWLRFKAEFNALYDDVDSGKVKIYYDYGNGFVNLVDEYHDGIPSFKKVSFKYKTSDGLNNNTAKIDNFSVTCEKDTCQNIIIVDQPNDIYVYEESNVEFIVQTKKSGNSFQWFAGDSILVGENKNIFSFGSASYPIDSGKVFKCKIVNDCDTIFTRTAMLHVLPCADPVITSQPLNCTTYVGGIAEFNVDAVGLGLTYQWKENNLNIIGANSNSLSFSVTNSNQNLGEYAVVISNSCGRHVYSRAAKLIIVDSLSPCTIIEHPMGDTIEVGDRYKTFVTVDCPDGKYNWYKNGSLLTNQINRILITDPVNLNDDGSEYFCVVDNGSFNDTSYSAFLKVLPPKNSNRLITISGELTRSDGVNVGIENEVPVEFFVDLFESQVGGISLYNETFEEKDLIYVKNGAFNITLGRGKATENLQKVVSENKNLFVEIRAGKNRELTGPRMALTAAPYAFSQGASVMYGKGNPNDDEIEAAVGSLYVDQLDNNRTWKKVKSNWIKLD